MNTQSNKSFLEFLSEKEIQVKFINLESWFLGLNEGEDEFRMNTKSFIDLMINDRSVPLSPFVPFKVKIKSKLRSGYKFRRYSKEDLIDEYKILGLNQYLKYRVPGKYYSKSILSMTRQIRDRIKHGYHYFCSIDIEDFFDSIDHKQLLEKVKSFDQDLVDKYTKNYLDTYRSSSGYHRGIPLGVNLSHILSEIYLMEFDDHIITICKEQDCYYYRYCDDMLILAKDKKIIDKVSKQIKITLSNLILYPNIDKESSGDLSKRNGGFRYLGYHHNLNELSIDPNTLRYIKSSLSRYAHNRPDKFVIGFRRFVCGYNPEWRRTERYNSFLTFPKGITPYYSLVNDGSEVQFERWLGSLFKYSDSNWGVNYGKPEGFRKWFYRYKKDFVRAHMKAFLREMAVGVSDKKITDFIKNILDDEGKLNYKNIRNKLIKYICKNSADAYYDLEVENNGKFSLNNEAQWDDNDDDLDFEDDSVDYWDVAGDPDLVENIGFY